MAAKKVVTVAVAVKKMPPWMAKSEKKEGKKEPKESMKMMGMEKKMGVEKYKKGGKC